MLTRAALLTILCLFVPALTSASFAQQANQRPKLSDAEPGSVRVFVSGALRAPLLNVKAQAEQAVGHSIFMEAGESRMLQSDIESGQPFEVALITRPVIDEMVRKGRILPGSDLDVGVVRVGVAVKGDIPADTDISTPSGLKKAMEGAASVRRFYGVGASVPTLDNLFTKLQIGNSLDGKIVALGVGRPAPEPDLKPGEYEMMINLASEVIPMKGWKYLGLIPEQFQMPVVMSAGIGSSGDANTARALLSFLKSEQFGQALKANGMSRR